MTGKVGYVYLLAGRAPGVEQKIRDQAHALRAMGAGDFEVLVVGPNPDLDVSPARFLWHSRRSPRDHVDYALRRFRVLQRALEDEELETILLRYPLADSHAPVFAAEHRVVSEHHAKEVEERAALSDSGAGVAQRLHKRISLASERRHGPPYLSACAAIIAVTDEIRQYELGRAATALPSIVVPNGIAVDRVTHTRFRPFDGHTLSLVFVGGKESPWHGADRLLRSLTSHRGSVEVTCHIVGDVQVPRNIGKLPSNVRIERWGVLNSGELDKLMATATIAVSTLGLHRKGLRQAAPLKSREYVARGIPFVAAYEDPDLADPDAGSLFCMRVPADESPIALDGLIEFADRSARLERADSLSTSMRAYARDHMDWKPKMERVLRFLRALPA